jgi:glutamate dehydrogenase
MAFFTAASKADFQQQLKVALAQHVDEKLLPQVGLFAEQFFGIVALPELTQRRMTDLVGSTLASWRLLERFDPSSPVVQVFNPDYEKHGWQSTHSVVEVLHPDMPFLVDSVRMELTRRGYAIHTLQNSVLQVRRDGDGSLVELLPKGSSGDGSGAESLIFVEIDRCASAAALHELEQSLHGVLADVRLTVSDFPAMKAKAEEHHARLAMLQPADHAQLAESMDFMRWLAEDHFTFLGYEEFTVVEQGEGGRIIYDEASLLGLSRNLRTGLEADDQLIMPPALAYLQEPLLLSFAKAATPSRVHRPAYPDFVSIREFDEQGRVTRECRFLGLFTSSVYTQSVRRIPYIRSKVAEVIQRSHFDDSAHLGKELAQVVEVLPRDDLFQTPVDELFSTVMSIVQIQERNKIRVFLRKDPYGRFCYCLAYVPRDVYSTEVRQKIQQVLMDRLKASDCEFWTFFSESVLIRVQIPAASDPKQPQVDIRPAATGKRSGPGLPNLAGRLLQPGDGKLRRSPRHQRAGGLPERLPGRLPRALSRAHSAAVDMQHVLSLTEQRPLVMSFYQPLTAVSGQSGAALQALPCLNTSLALSDVLPILENLGLRVLGEFPYPPAAPGWPRVLDP